MKKGKFIIFFLLAFSLIKLSANEEMKIEENFDSTVAENYNNKGLGFTAGQISGIGFAYRQYFEKNGMQFTFGLLSNADKVPKFSDNTYDSTSIKKTGWEVDGWLSFMYLRTLRDSENTKFYYFVGASLNIDYAEEYTQNYQYDPYAGEIIKLGSPKKSGLNKNSYYFGPGIGLDLKVSKYISFIIELPVSISSDKKIETYIPQGGVLIKF